MEGQEFSAKSLQDAITEACQKLGVTSDKLEYEVVEEGRDGFLGLGSKPATIIAKIKDSDVSGAARAFLEDVFHAMNLEVSIEIAYDEAQRNMDIELSGDEMGLLIGKRGATLDSLQYLVSLVVNKGTEEYIRVKVDTENYRERRKETLENLAKNVAHKVRNTGKPYELEPMNPYERRIIHSALQDNRYVETSSDGEEPNRHVVVKLKEGVKPEYSRQNRGKRY
ncbi:MAG: protein jag [Lachnospiraceae bacterium]|nr:protein jag [Lachnospiraceae bacterium]